MSTCLNCGKNFEVSFFLGGTWKCPECFRLEQQSKKEQQFLQDLESKRQQSKSIQVIQDSRVERWERFNAKIESAKQFLTAEMYEDATRSVVEASSIANKPDEKIEVSMLFVSIGIGSGKTKMVAQYGKIFIEQLETEIVKHEFKTAKEDTDAPFQLFTAWALTLELLAKQGLPNASYQEIVRSAKHKVNQELREQEQDTEKTSISLEKGPTALNPLKNPAQSKQENHNNATQLLGTSKQGDATAKWIGLGMLILITLGVLYGTAAVYFGPPKFDTPKIATPQITNSTNSAAQSNATTDQSTNVNWAAQVNLEKMEILTRHGELQVAKRNDGHAVFLDGNQIFKDESISVTIAQTFKIDDADVILFQCAQSASLSFFYIATIKSKNDVAFSPVFGTGSDYFKAEERNKEVLVMMPNRDGKVEHFVYRSGQVTANTSR